MEHKFILSENDICQAIAEWLTEYENLDIENGTVLFEKLKDGNYLITVNEHGIN